MDDYTASLEAKRQSLLQAGVRMMDPSAVYVEDTVTVARAPFCCLGPSCGGTPQ